MSKTPKQLLQPIVISVREMWTYLWGDEAAEDAPASHPDSHVIYEASVTLDGTAPSSVDGASGQTPRAEAQSPSEHPDGSSNASSDEHKDSPASST